MPLHIWCYRAAVAGQAPAAILERFRWEISIWTPDDRKKFEEAITQLEEDRDNPLTMELLVQAYYETGQTEKLNEIEERLRGTNVPTMEQALVVPAVRAKLPIM